jgi:hypothetical protein
MRLKEGESYTGKSHKDGRKYIKIEEVCRMTLPERYSIEGTSLDTFMSSLEGVRTKLKQSKLKKPQSRICS